MAYTHTCVCTPCTGARADGKKYLINNYTRTQNTRIAPKIYTI